MTISRRLAAAAVVVLAAAAGCTASGTGATKSVANDVPHAGAAASAPVRSAVVGAGAGAGATSAPIAPTHATVAVLPVAGGVARPDRALTPGESFPGVSAERVCVPGYSSSVRDVSTAVRYQVFAEYGVSYSQHASYEVDHLIPLELGGDNALANLWPEPNGGGQPGYPSKDKLENRLHALVCAHQVDLAVAQRSIATDWYAALTTYMSMPVTAPSRAAPAAVPTAAATPGNQVSAGGPTAGCRDGTQSYAQHHQGACSQHGGVAAFYR